MADREDDTIQRPPLNPAYFSAIANALFPHLTDPSTYQALAPPSMTPNPAGKVRAVESDPRQQGVLADIGNALSLGVPFGSPLAGAAKLSAVIPFVRRALPEAKGLAARAVRASQSPSVVYLDKGVRMPPEQINERIGQLQSMMDKLDKDFPGAYPAARTQYEKELQDLQSQLRDPIYSSIDWNNQP